jgi:hypothetical protein
MWITVRKDEGEPWDKHPHIKKFMFSITYGEKGKRKRLIWDSGDDWLNLILELNELLNEQK